MTKETKLRSIPVERGGRYLIIAEAHRALSKHENQWLRHAIDALNTWLVDENTPFKMIVLFDMDIRFERVKAAGNETQHEGD